MLGKANGAGYGQHRHGAVADLRWIDKPPVRVPQHRFGKRAVQCLRHIQHAEAAAGAVEPPGGGLPRSRREEDWADAQPMYADERTAGCKCLHGKRRGCEPRRGQGGRPGGTAPRSRVHPKAYRSHVGFARCAAPGPRRLLLGCKASSGEMSPRESSLCQQECRSAPKAPARPSRASTAANPGTVLAVLARSERPDTANRLPDTDTEQLAGCAAACPRPGGKCRLARVRRPRPTAARPPPPTRRSRSAAPRAHASARGSSEREAANAAGSPSARATAPKSVGADKGLTKRFDGWPSARCVPSACSARRKKAFRTMSPEARPCG